MNRDYLGGETSVQTRQAAMRRNTPRLCIISPMVGQHRGFNPSQGLIMSRLFTQAGYSVVAASPARNRYLRLLDVVRTLILYGKSVDLVLIDIYGGLSFVIEFTATLLAKAFGRPIVMVIHGGSVPRFVMRFPKVVRWVFQRARVLVCPSEYLRERLSRLGYSVHVIPNMVVVDNYQFRLRNDLPPKLLWMRAFHGIYDPLFAVRILASLRKIYPEAMLTMAGPDKGALASTKTLAASLGVMDAITFPGFLDAAQKRRHFGEAAIFLNTSNVDNMPVCFLEAWAAGLPIVTSAAGGIPYMIHDGVTGLLYPPGDCDAAVAAVSRLLADPELARGLSERGRAEAFKHDWARVRPLWEELFSKVLK